MSMHRKYFSVKKKINNIKEKGEETNPNQCIFSFQNLQVAALLHLQQRLQII